MKMSKNEISDYYRVGPDKDVKVSDFDPSERRFFDFGKDEYHGVFAGLTAELRRHQQMLYAQDKHRLLIVIQAMDTGGKDGCVRHVFSTVDPQGIIVSSFKKPSAEELAHDFLWRVHKKVPQNGQIAVFNRSHYEDIIAVRVKKLYDDEVWKRRYRHIVEFERMLAEEGTTILKFFLNISKEEQRERLQARLDTPAKHWKFNPDDLADRARWDKFMDAYSDILSKTSTKYAPWHVIPANKKWHRNLCVAQIVLDAMKNLNMSFPSPDWDPADMRVE